jgi:hypothetical protein
MQLLFTLDELRLLADVLEQYLQEPPQENQKAIEDLLEKVFTRRLQFAADELDLLAGLLLERTHEHPETGADKRKLLQGVLDKVTEACAMA